MKLKNRFKKNGSFFAYSIIIATLLVLPTLANAATYYVSTNGNDANPGSKAASFRTIKYALGKLVANDTLFIRGGTYLERLWSHQGTNFPSGDSWTNPVTVVVFPGEQATLVGSMTLGFANPSIQYLIIDGLIIDAIGEDAGISINGGTHHVKFINGEVKNAVGTAAIQMTYHNDSNPGKTFLEFINMNVHHNGLDTSYYKNGGTSNNYHAFYVKTSGNLIENCQIHDNAAWGIHNYLLSGEIRTKDNIFRNNRIWKNGSGGITVNRSDYNLLYNNVIWNNLNGIWVNSIGNPLGTKVYNNTVYGNKEYGIGALTGSIDTQIINNISYQNAQNLIDNGINTTISKNLTTNPHFIDEVTADFHLQAGSTNALDKGIPLGEVKTDKDGITRSPVSPDIGAYEYHLISEAPQNLRLISK